MRPVLKPFPLMITLLATAGLARDAHAAAGHAAAAHAAAAPDVVIHAEQEGRYPSVAADAKGGLHIAYVARQQSKDAEDVFYTTSKDGKSWSAAVNVSNTPGSSMEPSIAVDSHGGLVVAWSESVPGGTFPDIFSSASSDGGKTWSEPVNISSTPTQSGASSVSASVDGIFHMVWTDTGAGDKQSDIWYSRSIDHGLNWDKAVDLSNTPGVSNATELAVGPKGELAVTWSDTTGPGGAQSDIWFTVSTDGGKTWAKATNISNTPGISANPAIAIDAKDAIYVAWDDISAGDTRPDIFLLVSHDAGKTFDKSINISKTPGISSNPEIAAAGDGQLAVVWVDMSRDASTPDIWFAGSVNGGKTLGKSRDLTNAEGACTSPGVVITGGKAHVVWEEDLPTQANVRTLETTLK